MPKRDIVVVGASAGGREALVELVRTLPPDFPATLLVVWHMSASSPGLLPYVLERAGPLPAVNAENNMPIVTGRIYVAPVDHHLLVETDRVRVTRGPKENRFRPAIDPLFRSAAVAFGPRVIGLILSGALNDGTAGLWAIKDRGGIAMVQDPADAIATGMPTSALENVQVDYCAPVSEIAPLLMQLVAQTVQPDPVRPGSEGLEVELKFAQEKPISETQVQELGQVSEFTCPECHGTLWKMYDGKLLRFRCRTGHAYSADALLEDMAQSIEAMEWAALRGIEESAELMQHLADHLARKGDTEGASSFLKQAAHARKRSEIVRQALTHDELALDRTGGGTAPV